MVEFPTSSSILLYFFSYIITLSIFPKMACHLGLSPNCKKAKKEASKRYSKSMVHAKIVNTPERIQDDHSQEKIMRMMRIRIKMFFKNSKIQQ